MLSIRILKQLSHFTLDFESKIGDEIAVLFGPSGSGKTTILNTIAGLVHPDKGYIRLNDRDFFIEGKSPIPLHQRQVGYLFQDYALFPHMTVKKNIYYGVKRGRTEHSRYSVDSLIQLLGIQHLLDQYPHQISGGEKQRVALARALATEPSILLLDEPLSALDQETRWECQNELERIHRMWKIPFIIVTHDRDEAERLGNQILFIKEGKIVNRVRKEG